MRVSLANLAIIIAALSVLLIVTLVAVRVARRLHERSLRFHKAPTLVMPLSSPPVRTTQPNAAREAAYLRLEESKSRLAPELEVFPPAEPLFSRDSPAAPGSPDDGHADARDADGDVRQS